MVQTTNDNIQSSTVSSVSEIDPSVSETNFVKVDRIPEATMNKEQQGVSMMTLSPVNMQKNESDRAMAAAECCTKQSNPFVDHPFLTKGAAVVGSLVVIAIAVGLVYFISTYGIGLLLLMLIVMAVFISGGFAISYLMAFIGGGGKKNNDEVQTEQELAKVEDGTGTSEYQLQQDDAVLV